MKLFRKSTPSWPPAWSYDAGTLIWRILFSNAGEILGEARDPEAKQTSFFCLNEADGRPKWKDLRLDEPWWIGIEAIDAGRFYLHGFRKPDMPQHLGIRAFDLQSGKELWNNAEMAFLLAKDGDVYASREGFSGMKFFRLSSEDGSVIEELGQDTDRVNALRAELNEEDYFRGYRYPEPAGDNHPLKAVAVKALSSVMKPEHVVGNLDVLVEEPLLFAAWHAPDTSANGERRLLKQEFHAVHTETGKTLFRDCILTGAEAPGMDSFFIKDAQLIYIRERQEIVAHDLNGVAS